MKNNRNIAVFFILLLFGMVNVSSIFSFNQSNVDEYMEKKRQEAVERGCKIIGYNYFPSDSPVQSVPIHTHNYEKTITKEATCSEEGIITYTCPGCGSTRTEAIPKIDHTWTETVVTPATCSTEGQVKKVCSVCGEEVIEVIPCNPEVHDYEEIIVKEPTCTVDGSAKKVCKGCGAETEEYSIPAIGHNYEASVTKEPTCTEVGIKTFTCANCGDTYTEDIPALGHDETSAYVYKAKIGSLVFDGKTVYTCSRCGEVREEADPSTYPIIYLISAVVLLVVIITTIIVLIVTRKVKKDGE